MNTMEEFRRTVYQCEGCGRFADGPRTTCAPDCDGPAYVLQGTAVFYLEKGAYRWRLETFEPAVEEVR